MEVREQRGLDIVWRPISLKLLNAEHRRKKWYAERRDGHLFGHMGLRIAVAANDNDTVDALYTAAGELIHRRKRADALSADPVAGWATVLRVAGLDADLLAAATDLSYDAALQASTDLALSRTGRDVGTPILTFHPGTKQENSFFGPVISSIPRGTEAVRLYDAVATAASFTALSELKRTKRATLNFR